MIILFRQEWFQLKTLLIPDRSSTLRKDQWRVRCEISARVKILIQKLAHTLWARSPKPVRKLVVRLTQPSFRATVAVVVALPDRRVLLLHHLFRGRRAWGVPAGFIERGEQPRESAARELREETGIEIDPDELKLLSSVVIRDWIVETGFSIELGNEVEPAVNFELDGYEWADPEHLPDDISPESRTLIERWLGSKVR